MDLIKSFGYFPRKLNLGLHSFLCTTKWVFGECKCVQEYPKRPHFLKYLEFKRTKRKKFYPELE